MLKKLLILLVCPTLLFSADVLTKTFNFDEPQIKDNVLRMTGCRTTLQGFVPSVAVKGVRLALPVGYTAKSYTVSYGTLKTKKGTFYLKPVTPPITVGKAKPANYDAIKDDVYKVNGFFPEATKSGTFSIQSKAGISVFITTISPSQYNPQTGVVQYYSSVTVDVALKPLSRGETPVYNCTPASKSMLQYSIDNPEDIIDLPYVQKDENDYEYLIITSDLLKDAWGDMIALNTRRGMRTKVYTLQHIRGAISSGTDPEKMRAFIKQEYTNSRIVYVLLGGDIGPSGGAAYHLPSNQKFYSKYYDHHIADDRLNTKNNICTDIYFSTLDGTWKNNASESMYGKYPAGDWFWEVYASRFPVDNKSEVDNLVRKTRMYAEEPVKNEIKNALFLGNELWDWTGTNKKIWGAMFMNELWGDGAYNGSSYTNYQGHQYTTYRIPKTGWTIDSLYDRTGRWNVSRLRSKVSSVRPTWFEHAGHGNVSSAFNTTTSTATNSNFPNDGRNGNFFIVTTMACKPQSFHKADECLLEKLLNIQNGAVITSGSTESGQLDDDGTDGSGNRPFRWLHDALFNPNKRVHYWEMMHALGKEVDVDIVTKEGLMVAPYHNCLRYLHYLINSCGDPALSIWTDTPKDLTGAFEYTATKEKFTMKTPPYTWVALADKSTGKIFTTQLTGYVYDANNSFKPTDSACSISDKPYTDYAKNNTTVKVYIKAHNYLPKSFELPIASTGIQTRNAGIINKYSVKSLHGYVLVNFTITSADNVRLSLYNSKGVLVKNILNEKVQAGNRQIRIPTAHLSNGIYYCKALTGNAESVQQCIVAH